MVDRNHTLCKLFSEGFFLLSCQNLFGTFLCMAWHYNNVQGSLAQTIHTYTTHAITHQSVKILLLSVVLIVSVVVYMTQICINKIPSNNNYLYR